MTFRFLFGAVACARGSRTLVLLGVLVVVVVVEVVVVVVVVVVVSESDSDVSWLRSKSTTADFS
jgi:hypothetical protein